MIKKLLRYKVDLFDRKAYTLNIPAQLALKHDYLLVPLEIKRENKINFSINIKDPLIIDENDDQYSVTKKLTWNLKK